MKGWYCQWSPVEGKETGKSKSAK